MRLLLLFSLSLTCFLAYSGEVNGTLTNTKNEPVPFANVLLFSKSDSSFVKAAVSDSTGKFSIKLPSDTILYYLNIQPVEYSAKITPPFKGSKNFGNIQLSSTKIEEVSITVKKPLIEVTGRGVVMNVKDSPILEGSNGLEIVEKIPGAQLNLDGSISYKGKQGMRIYFDGKPSQMDLTQLMAYLKSTPSDEIERIEVYEVPPAKFDASGNAGIINIIRRRGKHYGFNGMSGLNIGYGNFYKFGNWNSLNYRTKKFNAYSSFGYHDNKWDQLSSEDIRITDHGGTSSFFNKYRQITRHNGIWGRAGIDLFLGKKNTLGYLVVGWDGGMRQTQPSTVNVTGPNDTLYNLLEADQNAHFYWSGHNHNINFKRNIDKGETLNIDVDFAVNDGGRETTNDNRYFLNGTALTPYYNKQLGGTKRKYGVAKLDYEKTIFGSWAMETGAKASYVVNENNFDAFQGTNQDDIAENFNLSNDFEYKEAIFSAYGSFVRKWENGWLVDLGLRLEHTLAEGHSLTTTEKFTRNFFNYFPNISVRYGKQKKYSVSAAYSRRINRPQYWQMNPFQLQRNQYIFERGNPELLPAISDVATLSYGFKDAFYLTWSGTITNGLLNQVIEQNEAEQTQVYYLDNLDDFYNTSLNATLPIPVTKWLTMSFNLTGYYNKMQSKVEESNVGYELWSYNLNLRNNLKLPKGYWLELSGFYNGPSYWGLFYAFPHYQIDFGASKQYNNWRFNLAVKDFLNIRQGIGGVFQGDIYMPNTYKPESRKVILSVSYRYGKKTVKAARRRKTGSEDIEKRSGD